MHIGIFFVVVLIIGCISRYRDMQPIISIYFMTSTVKLVNP